MPSSSYEPSFCARDAYTLAMPEPTGGTGLAFSVIAGDPPGPRVLYVLHGIYGRGRNWAAIARHLSVRRSDWQSVLIDLRLHGQSPAYLPPHTVAACADDLLAFEQAATLGPRALLGHSFGGKVALAFAARTDVRPLQVWIVDSTPAAMSPQGTAWEMLRVVESLPQRFASRQQAVTALSERGIAPAVGAWMATNLVPHDGEFVWRLDFTAMRALLEDFFRCDLWDVVEQPSRDVELHFVKATESNTLAEGACARIEAAARQHGQVSLHRVQGGHWLNTDNPEALLSLLHARLPRA